MTICFDINTKFTDIVAILAGIDDTDITACYETGETEHYNRNVSTSMEIASSIDHHLEETRDALSEMIHEQEENTVDENDDERYEAMYEAYLAEMEYRYDAEDAILNHYA